MDRLTAPLSAPNQRLSIYLAACFAISWTCWWTLAALVPPGSSPAASHLFKALYLGGGLGPAIGALVAVALTPQAGEPVEYVSRLTRWRVHPLWWLAVLAVPVAIAGAREWVSVWAGAGAVRAAPLAPLATAATLFPAMILGGGLEEMGWRGVAQPGVEARAPRLVAAVIVGLIWALWHLPLFHIPGTPQFGRFFPLFAVDVLANALLLAWIYAGTRSILLCILFHAVSNTATAMGLVAIGSPVGAAAWAPTALKLGLAVLLLATVRRRRADQSATIPLQVSSRKAVKRVVRDP